MEELDFKELHNAPVGDAPWYFRLARYLARRKIRGGDRLVLEARKRGLLDRLAEYPLANDVTLQVPLWRPCNSWDQEDVLRYEAAFMRGLSSAIHQLPHGVTFVDCGADIGTVSAHIVSRCKNVASVIAFEPNRAAHAVLAHNLAAMRIRTEARNVAVGDFTGRGTLVTPETDPSAHAAFIVPSCDGTIPVQRIDDLDLPPGAPCAIKIDVEGSECNVVQGAARTIERAGELLVAFEAHPKVAARTKQDPVEVMCALLDTGRDFAFGVDDGPATAVTADHAFFKQVPPNRVYNVIARSILH